MSLARQSENEGMIKEIEKILKEKCSIDSADVTSKKKDGGSRTLRILGSRRSSIMFNMSSVPMESTESSACRDGFSRIRAQQKLRWKHKEACKSSWNPRGN